MDLPIPYSVPPPKLDRPPPSMPPPVYKPPPLYTLPPPPIGPLNVPPPKLPPQPVPAPMLPPTPPPPPYYPMTRDLPPAYSDSRCYSPSSAFRDLYYSPKHSASHASRDVKQETRSWDTVKRERDSSPSFSESSYRSVKNNSTRESPHRSHSSQSRDYYKYRRESSHRSRDHDRERRDRHDKYRSNRSPSSGSSHYGRSPPRYSNRKKHYKEIEREEKRNYYDKLKAYQQKREQLLKVRSPSYFKDRGIHHDRHYDELHDRPRESRSHSRRSQSYRPNTPPRSRHTSGSHKPLTDREKILEDYRYFIFN